MSVTACGRRDPWVHELTGSLKTMNRDDAMMNEAAGMVGGGLGVLVRRMRMEV